MIDTNSTNFQLATLIVHSLKHFSSTTHQNSVAKDKADQSRSKLKDLAQIVEGGPVGAPMQVTS